jgi:hypothetical protein
VVISAILDYLFALAVGTFHAFFRLYLFILPLIPLLTSALRLLSTNSNISQIEHSRHRSPINAMINIICKLLAYCHQPKKPSLHMEWALPPSA